ERSGRRDPDQGLTTTSLPSRNLVPCGVHAPPGAPLRNGAIVILSLSPALRLWLDHPSRARALGVTPSRFQTVMLPSCDLASKRINVWGLVYLNPARRLRVRSDSRYRTSQRSGAPSPRHPSRSKYR